jgi:hypothetical protein
MNFVEHLDDLWRGIVFSAAAVAIRRRSQPHAPRDNASAA